MPSAVASRGNEGSPAVLSCTLAVAPSLRISTRIFPLPCHTQMAVDGQRDSSRSSAKRTRTAPALTVSPALTVTSTANSGSAGLDPSQVTARIRNVNAAIFMETLPGSFVLLSVLDHVHHMPQRTHVGERVAIQNGDIGKFARRHGAEAVLFQKSCRPVSGGAD